MCDVHMRIGWGDVTSLAASQGDLEALAGFLEDGPDVADTVTAAAAASTGQVEALRMLHGAGCEWDMRAVCAVAAAYGHADCLVYARQNGSVANDRAVDLVGVNDGTDHGARNGTGPDGGRAGGATVGALGRNLAARAGGRTSLQDHAP